MVAPAIAPHIGCYFHKILPNSLEKKFRIARAQILEKLLLQLVMVLTV